MEGTQDRLMHPQTFHALIGAYEKAFIFPQRKASASGLVSLQYRWELAMDIQHHVLNTTGHFIRCYAGI